ARAMAEGCEALRFVPLGRHGRAVWVDVGPPAERMARHLAAVTAALQDARHELARVADWQGRARAAMAGIKGDNPARVIQALAAHPILNAAMLEESAGISRDTAERMLARMRELGLAREITGGRRFRLWVLAG
uniref:helix-turn-helix domain-containing protein n=1 Tax=Paracoccus binzhouensis TaxID=2796149 RepID=UPI0022B918F8